MEETRTRYPGRKNQRTGGDTLGKLVGEISFEGELVRKEPIGDPFKRNRKEIARLETGPVFGDRVAVKKYRMKEHTYLKAALR